MTFGEHAGATLILTVAEQVLVERHQFYLLTMGSSPTTDLKTPDKLLFAGPGGAVFWSGGTDHIATVTFELWSAEPETDTREDWEAREQGTLIADVENFSFRGRKWRVRPASSAACARCL